jgi:hypothetical protein
MANYYARVELHGASWPEDYEELHEALRKRGFTNCVPTSNGNTWRLPTGFYYSTGRDDDKDIVAKAVKESADSTGYENELVVIKTSGSNIYLSTRC